MKKLLLTVLAALVASGAFAQEAFPDIPAGHWAGDAVKRIADLGIVIGFPDGTFRGNESFTRYQMALVISRLLDVINADIDALRALHESDIASLRNALQELASDVAAQGVRLNAVEGAVAAISDDVVSNTARIEALEAVVNEHMANHPDGMDPAVLDAIQDLQNQIASLRVAADTAQAQADAAAAAAAGAADAAAAAQATANQNAAAIDAINDLLALLNSDVEGLSGDVAGLSDRLAAVEARDFEIPADLLAQVDRNSSDIANIREFVILLRRDQVALRDRVAALEASDASQQAAIDDLSARLTKVEEDLFLISGSIEIKYRVDRSSGDDPPFDSDRTWGLNNDRDIGASNFSSGTDDVNDDDDKTDAGEVAQDREDIDDRDAGDDGFEANLTLNVGFGTDRNGVGDPRALNSFDTVIKLGMKKAANLCVEADCSDGDDPFEGYVFTVDEFTTTFDPIGAAPLTFAYGESPSASFTPYVFDMGGPGFVATLGAPDFLAFLNPTLMIVGGAGGNDTYASGVNIADDYVRGIRGTLNPLQGDNLSVTGGFSFAQYAANAGENADAASDNAGVTVWGVDAQIGISILDINAEYASQSVSGTLPAGISAADASLLYVMADVNVGELGIPILKSLSANYRDIPTAADWFGILTDDDDQPFAYDQTGFGVKGTLSLFILDITGYFDSYSTTDPAADVSAFGVDASANLFAGFSLTGFFHSASINGTTVDDLSGGIDGDEDVVVAGVDRDNNYDTGFGVKLAHSGSASNALIPNLNLSAEYKQTEADFSKTTIDVNADYMLTISILTLDPYVGFKSVSDSDAGSDNTTTIKAGTGIKTEPLNIFLSPSLEGAVNFRTTSHSAPEYSASELQWAVGLSLNRFLFDNSTLRVRYGSWTGTNVSTNKNTIGSGDNATDISDGDAFDAALGNVTQTTSGYEVAWDYWDLQFAYGAYTNSNDQGSDPDLTSAAQAFKIRYKVTF